MAYSFCSLCFLPSFSSYILFGTRVIMVIDRTCIGFGLFGGPKLVHILTPPLRALANANANACCKEPKTSITFNSSFAPPPQSSCMHKNKDTSLAFHYVLLRLGISAK